MSDAIIVKYPDVVNKYIERCYDNEVPDIEVPDPSKDIEVPVTLRSQTLELITNLSLLT